MSFPPPPRIPGELGTDAADLLRYFAEVAAWANAGGPISYVFLDTRAGPVSHTLPDGDITSAVSIKDKYLTAHSHNITVYGDGVTLIDGRPNFVMNQNGQANTFVWNGDSWSVT